jgi:hypothetical protein
MGQMRNAYKFLVEKHEVNRPLGRHKHRKKNMLISMSEKQGVRAWTGFNLLVIGSNGELLSSR